MRGGTTHLLSCVCQLARVTVAAPKAHQIFTTNSLRPAPTTASSSDSLLRGDSLGGGSGGGWCGLLLRLVQGWAAWGGGGGSGMGGDGHSGASGLANGGGGWLTAGLGGVLLALWGLVGFGGFACSGTRPAPFRATACPRRAQPRGGRSAASGTSARRAGACLQHQQWLLQSPVEVGQCAWYCPRERSQVGRLSLRAALPGSCWASRCEMLCWRILEEEQSVCQEQCVRYRGHEGVHEFDCQHTLMPEPPRRPPPGPEDPVVGESGGGIRQRKRRCM